MPRHSTRRAFTMVELLIVLAIVAVLVSLTAVAALHSIGTQQHANTANELNSIKAELTSAWRHEASLREKEAMPDSFVLPYGAERDAARAAWVAQHMQAAFPQALSEATPQAWPELQGVVCTPAQESSVCLAAILHRTGQDPGNQAPLGGWGGVMDGYGKPVTFARTASGLTVTASDGQKVAAP